MKVKYLGTLLLALTAFYGCNDNTGTLGMGMLPDSDGINAQTTTFDVITNSYLAKKIYAKTSTGYVGRFTDPDPNGFGDYEASFLTELNCADDFRFPAVYNDKTHTGIMTADTVSAVQLTIFYSTWFGDSVNPCRMSVYELEKNLEKKSAANRYTDINPKDYYSEDGINKGFFRLRKAYTAYDASVPDSVRNATDSQGNKQFYPNVTLPLSKAYGNKILKLNREYQEKKNDYFKNADNFIKNVLKGVYIKTDYGDGTILYVDRVDLQMQFRFHHVDSTGVKLTKKVTDDKGKAGEDSLYYSMATVFASTKEVIQANNFVNSAKLETLAKETAHTYLKSPAGIFTEATLPYDAIYKELTNDTLNAVKLTFTNYDQSDNKFKFKMTAPQEVLLVRKADMDSFFAENKVTDNITSFAAIHNYIATNQYTFKNIARLVSTCINEKKDAKAKAKKDAGAAWNEVKEREWEAKWKTDNPDWDKVMLIPVKITYDSSQKSMTSIQHDLRPTAAKLKVGSSDNPIKIEVTYTSFNIAK